MLLDNLILRNNNINLIVNDITRFSRHNLYGLALLKRCLKNNINIHFVKEKVIFDHTNEYISTKILSGLNNSEGEWQTIRQNIINNWNGTGGVLTYTFDNVGSTVRLIGP